MMTDAMWATRGFGRYLAPLSTPHDASVELHVNQQHLNVAGRLHGGMAMSLQSLALRSAARAGITDPSGVASFGLMSLNCDLLGAADLGNRISARATVTRSTRTMCFVAGGLYEGERPLMNATAIFTKVAERLESATPDGFCASSLQCQPVRPRDPFCADIGGIYERYGTDGARIGVLHVRDEHLDALGSARVDDGLIAWLTDIFHGRLASEAARRPCITVAMSIAQVAPVGRGDVLEVHSDLAGISPDVVCVSGRALRNGKSVFSTRSLWKIRQATPQKSGAPQSS